MGATVIDAKAKYYREPIATLDFMSLYPSIILANNFTSRRWCRTPATKTCRASTTPSSG